MNNKKIGTFLMIVLILCAVLLLMATAQDPSGGAPAGPVETTAAPSAPERGPTDPVQTTDRAEPTGTAPGTQPDVPEGTQGTAPAEPDRKSQTAALVEQILEQSAPDRTAVTRRSYEEGLNRLEGAAGGADRSAAYALAELAGERRMNPIAAFWLLVSEGVCSKREDQSGVLKTEAFSPPAHGAKAYAYDDEGARQLLTDILVLSAEIRDELELERAILGANLTVEPDQISFSEADGCRYAYFSSASPYSTHILCFYLRAGGKGAWIDDVEFQLLSMRHADGEDAVLEQISGTFDRQAASLIAAAELLMTGKTRAGEGEIPFSYEAAEYAAALERFRFTGEDERGTLTNYRLRAK